MYKKQGFRSSRSDMAVSFSQPRQNDPLIIAKLLRAFRDIVLCAGLVSNIYKLSVCDGRSRSLGFLLVNGVDVAIDDRVCFLCHKFYLSSRIVSFTSFSSSEYNFSIQQCFSHLTAY